MNNLPSNVTEVFNDGQQAYYKVRMNFNKTFLIERINEYLSNGGLFNPEYTNHDKVRDLLIDCREELIRMKDNKWNQNMSY